MQELRQGSTVTVEYGPILDADGLPYGTDDLDYSDFYIRQAGSKAALDASAVVGLADANAGAFAVTLTANDVDTLGRLDLVLSAADLVGPVVRFMVLDPYEFDAKYVLGTRKEQVFVECLKVVHGIPHASSLYFFKSTGDNGNSGLTPSLPKIDPGLITYAVGDGICPLDSVPFATRITCAAGMKLFGFGPETSRLVDSAAGDWTITQWKVGGPAIMLKEDCVISDLWLASNVALAVGHGGVAAGLVGIGPINGVQFRRCVLKGTLAGLGWQETANDNDITHLGGAIRFDDCRFWGTTGCDVYLDSGYFDFFFTRCQFSHFSPSASGFKSANIYINPASVGGMDGFRGRVFLDGCSLRNIATDNAAPIYGIYIASDTGANHPYGRIYVKDTRFQIHNIGSGGEKDISNNAAAGHFAVDLMNPDPLVTEGTGDIVYKEPGKSILADTAELQTEFVDGGRLDLILDLIRAGVCGKFTKSGDTYTFYAADDVTVLYTLTISATGRIVA